MTLLTKTDFRVEIVWLGIVADRQSGILAESRSSVEAGFEGFVGDDHSGITRPSCTRVKGQYAKGTEIRNTRQLSILSSEELSEIAKRLDLGELPPAWLGASMVLQGFQDFTLIPPATRLMFDNGVCITVDTENAPCHLPAAVIEKHYPGTGKAFKAAAQHKRGVTAWIERPGTLSLGDCATLHVPPPHRHPLL